ncbi:MAG TPA: DUF1634 domain-containing protein [Candidatus Limnocylindrales bacterium]
MGRDLEGTIARLLSIGTYVSIAFIAVGVVLLLVAGTSPLDAAPAFDAGRIPADLVGLKPEGFLFLGIVGLLVTPAARVAAALVGYARSGERRMVVVALLILLVIAVGVAVGTAAG